MSKIPNLTPIEDPSVKRRIVSVRRPFKMKVYGQSYITVMYLLDIFSEHIYSRGLYLNHLNCFPVGSFG